MTETGHFSVLRFLHNPVREEARNLAVIVFAGDATAARMDTDGLSGLAAYCVEAIVSRLSRGGLDEATSLSATMHRSFQITTPRPTVMKGDVEATADLLFKVYVERPPEVLR